MDMKQRIEQKMEQRPDPVLVYSVLEYFESIGLLNVVDCLHKDMAASLTREERAIWIKCINGSIKAFPLLQVWTNGLNPSSMQSPVREFGINKTKNGMLKTISILFPGRTPDSLNDEEKRMVVEHFKKEINKRTVSNLREAERQEPESMSQFVSSVMERTPFEETSHSNDNINFVCESEHKRRIFQEQQRKIEEKLNRETNPFDGNSFYESQSDIAKSVKDDKIQKKRVHMLNKMISIAENEKPVEQEKDDHPMQENDLKMPSSWAEPFVEIDFSDLLEESVLGNCEF